MPAIRAETLCHEGSRPWAAPTVLGINQYNSPPNLVNDQKYRYFGIWVSLQT